MTNKSKPARGYPVAVLIGFEEKTAYLWQVFSKLIKPMTIVGLDQNRMDSKGLYNFHEALLNALRQTLKEGIRSIIIASPPRTTYSQEFVTHLKKHHTWLTQGKNKVTISEITGLASTRSQVAQLANSIQFRDLIHETTVEETSNLLSIIEKRLTTSDRASEVLFSLIEAEDLILHSPKTSIRKAEYLILTDKYLANCLHKNRINRLLQISANRGIKTRIIASDSPAGKRITQFGGFVCLAKND